MLIDDKLRCTIPSADDGIYGPVTQDAAVHEHKYTDGPVAHQVRALQKAPVDETSLLGDDYVKIYNAVAGTNQFNYLQARIPIPSNLNIPAWEKHLDGYHDQCA